MLIPFGVFSAAGAGGGGGGTPSYELIQTTVLSSTSSSITFSSIPQTYKHLQIRAVMKSTDPVDFSTYGVSVRFNSDSGSNYSLHGLTGTGSAVNSFAATSQSRFQIATIPTSNGPVSSDYGSFVADILDYTSASKNTTVRSFGGQTYSGNRVNLYSGAWYNTSSVTSLNLFMQSTSWQFTVGTRVSLYGILG